MISQSTRSRKARQRFKAALWTAVFFVIAAAALQAQTVTILYNFAGPDGLGPNARLLQATDGNFYGTTAAGGAASSCSQPSQGCGTVFQFTPQGTLTTLHSFNGADGYSPSGLIQATDGKFYGTAGPLFSIVPGGSLVIVNSTISTFEPVIQVTDGTFYGTTGSGTQPNLCFSNCGSIFSATSAGALTTLYSFPACPSPGSSCPDGYGPGAGLVQGSDGNFYGTAQYGGNDYCGSGSPLYCGVIFKITPTGTYSPLYAFCSGGELNCPEGWGPGQLIQGSDGNFYGVTSFGSTCGQSYFVRCGAIFKMTPQGNVTVLHTFSFTDGGGPNTLVQATDGNFYGTTSGGGPTAMSDGTIFRITPEGSFVMLYSFSAITPTDGGSPTAGLIQAANGIFYGTTTNGGTNGDGTIFSFSLGLGGTTPSTTSLALAPSTVTVGSAGPVAMTATVAPASGSGTPTGSVSFVMGSTQLGLSALQNGVATLNYDPSALAVNTYQFTATYTGDSTYAASTSSAQTLTVTSLAQAATPTFSPQAGTYSSPQTVTLSDTTSGATIYYTNDGTAPTTSSAVYSSPLTVNSTETIRAIAAANGYTPSVVASATYTITLNPDYQLSVNPATLSIVAGQSGTATFTVTPMAGFNSQVSFSCSGLPAEATCAFNPSSVTPNGTPASSKLTVSTTAPSATIPMFWLDVRRPLYAAFLLGLGAMLALLRRRKPVGRALAPISIAGLLVLVVLLPSCGSGKSSSGSGGTPSGKSTVTVSASTSGSGAITHTATLTITITQ